MNELNNGLYDGFNNNYILSTLLIQSQEVINFPFNCSSKNYLKLSDTEKKGVNEAARLKNSQFINEYFKENPDIQWIVIFGDFDNVFIEGLDKNNLPAKDVLENFSKQSDRINFLFMRD